MKRWALITGRKGIGKTTAAVGVVQLLRAQGLTVGGVVQVAIEDQGERIGYRALRVDGTLSCMVAWRGAAPANVPPGNARERFCSFTFDQNALGLARHWVSAAARQADVVIVDEVSKLEVTGGGYHDAIREVLGGHALVLLVVRADQLIHVMDRFGLDEPVAVLDVTDHGAIGAFAGELVRAVDRKGATS